MTLGELAPLLIKLSVSLSVFSFGLSATLEDATRLFHRPGTLLRSVLAMNGVMFVLAMGVALVFPLHPAIEIGLVVLSLSSVPPVLTGKLLQAGAPLSAAVALVAAISVLALAIAPLGLALGQEIGGKEVRVPFLAIESAVLISVLVPLALGIASRHFAPRLAQRIAHPLQVSATVLLLLIAAPLLIVAWPGVAAMLGSGLLPALALFSLAGLLVGHVLGGPDEVHRTMLALATSARHPGMVLAMTGANHPEARALMAVVICHVVISSVVVLPYLVWRRRVQAHHEGLASAPQAT